MIYMDSLISYINSKFCHNIVENWIGLDLHPEEHNHILAVFSCIHPLLLHLENETF